MKYKKYLIGIFVCLAFLLSSQNTKAQDDPIAETAYELAYKEYQKELEEYQKSHADYILKRTQYLRFKTLESQQAAQESTVKMMQDRDDVITTYLNTLKERLAEAEGVNDTKKGSLNVRINSELNYFTAHRDRIPSAGSLKDLEADNKLARERFLFTEPLFYQVLATVSYGKLIDFDERLTDIFSELKSKITEIKGETREEYQLSDRQVTLLDRWVLEADNRMERAREKELAGESTLETFISAAQRRQQPLTIYNIALQRLVEGQTFLKEAGNFMREIIREVKSKD